MPKFVAKYKPIRVREINIYPYRKIKLFTLSLWMTYLRLTIEVCCPKLNHLVDGESIKCNC